MSEPESQPAEAAPPQPKGRHVEGSFAAMVAESIGGWRGMFDSGIPVVVFVAVNATTSLMPAVWSAIGAGAFIFLFRLVRRESVQQALGGFFAVALAAFIAARTGEARNYFVVAIVRNLGLAAICLVSVLVRRPLIGLIWEYVEGRGTAWRLEPSLMRIYRNLTLLWTGIFALRGVVQAFLYDRDETGWLAAASLAMGYPLFAAGGLVTVLVVRKLEKSRRSAPNPAE